MAGSDQPATTTENKSGASFSSTQPWAPAQPLLTGILGQLGGQSTAPTPAQTGAVANLQTSANSIPNFGAAGAGAVGNAFGTDTQPQQGMLSDAYDTQKNNLNPWASGSMNNPYSNPEIKGWLDTVTGDITNDVTSRFAAAGRSGSPAETQSLSRGLSQGLGGILSNQYNQNVSNQFGANAALMGGAGSTASGMTAQQLAALNAQLGGIQAGGMLSGLYTAPGQAQLGAANTGYGLPFQNIGMLEGLVNPIAGMGGTTAGTTTGTATGTQTPAKSPNSDAIGTALGVAGTAAQFLPMLMSDENVKENKEVVGGLLDGTPVWSYNYIGDPTPRIGVMAQEVEKTRPDAVVDIGGVKAVHYGKATERSRAIAGMLSDQFAMAA